MYKAGSTTKPTAVVIMSPPFTSLRRLAAMAWSRVLALASTSCVISRMSSSGHANATSGVSGLFAV